MGVEGQTDRTEMGTGHKKWMGEVSDLETRQVDFTRGGLHLYITSRSAFQSTAIEAGRQADRHIDRHKDRQT